MKKTIHVDVKDKVVDVATDIVYMQKRGWCQATNRQLKLSLLWERNSFPCDDKSKHPLLIWLCGGGFTGMDVNVWLAEMTYFTKKGYVVASVGYTVEAGTLFPEPETEVKAAIRYLRAHADEYYIDENRIAIAGESAGAYLAAFVGLTGDEKEYEVGEYKEYSSKVNAIITWYCPVKLPATKQPGPLNRPDLRIFVNETVPPILMFHGTDDRLVSCSESEMLYKAYEKANAKADLYLIEGANHGTQEFVQEEVKEMMLHFLNEFV